MRRLPRGVFEDASVRIATSRRSRLLGLALLERSEAGAGLLIPGCRSVHTFGMRFALDIAFLDAEGAVISRRAGVPRRRVVANRRASAVLETPAGGSG